MFLYWESGAEHMGGVQRAIVDGVWWDHSMALIDTYRLTL